MGRQRRGEIEIVFEILSALEESGTIFELQHRVRLANTPLKRQVDNLTDMALVSIINSSERGSNVYLVTQSGRRFAEQIKFYAEKTPLLVAEIGVSRQFVPSQL